MTSAGEIKREAPHLQTWYGWDARRRAAFPKALHLHWCSYTDRTYETLLAGWTASSQSGWVKGERALTRGDSGES